MFSTGFLSAAAGPSTPRTVSRLSAKQRLSPPSPPPHLPPPPSLKSTPLSKPFPAERPPSKSLFESYRALPPRTRIIGGLLFGVTTIAMNYVIEHSAEVQAITKDDTDGQERGIYERKLEEMQKKSEEEGQGQGDGDGDGKLRKHGVKLVIL
ncbi:hypothetical protein BCR39DRAFT_518068 [Naematelia encephala]|uniref:Uncharacterized protein n=1 Tax=Naematelia encephala TaxID=71784 RepID=A0A1Y2BHJ8_9TREE|nr:hypothetical protein BCR39DRAFT_518068 [Naematelia encephala]